MTDDPEITDPRDPYKRRDILAELDHWLRGSVQAEPHLILQRARDEIVALRAVLDIQKLLPDKFAMNVRDEALEAAAAACLRKARDHVIPIGQDNYHDGCISCAAAIRALKEKS